MAQYIAEILMEEFVTCENCNKTFNTNEITVDDFNFSWGNLTDDDNLVTKDCCSDCFDECLNEGE